MKKKIKSQKHPSGTLYDTEPGMEHNTATDIPPSQDCAM